MQQTIVNPIRLGMLPVKIPALLKGKSFECRQAGRGCLVAIEWSIP
jgi:hypothetical protein